MSRLGITRNAELLGELSKKAESVGVEIVSLPLIDTAAVDFELPDCQIDWIFFTSANGVGHFFNNISNLDFSDIKFAVVGDKTEIALNRFGLEASFKPTEAYGQNLFTEFIEQNNNKSLRIFFPRAEVINFDPQEILTDAGFEYYPIICYKTVVNNVEADKITGLDNKDAILFTAPSAVRSYQEQFGQPKARPIAIGRSTAAVMDQLSWKDIILMENPDIDKVLEYI